MESVILVVEWMVTLLFNAFLSLDCDHSVPLGMISGEIQDWQLSASSTYPQEWDKNCHERFARVYQANGRGWCARYKTSSEWLQVDLGVAAKVSKHGKSINIFSRSDASA